MIDHSFIIITHSLTNTMSSTKQNTVANAFRHHMMRGVSTSDDRSRNAGDVLRDDILKQIETATGTP